MSATLVEIKDPDISSCKIFINVNQICRVYEHAKSDEMKARCYLWMSDGHVATFYGSLSEFQALANKV